MATNKSTESVRSKPKLSPKPVKAIVFDKQRASEAWFYENAKSIDVYTYKVGAGSQCCRVPIAKIRDWLRRVDGR